MKPKLLVINGNPGMGKSTLAERYANEHPLTLNLDIDRIWHMMGGWQDALHDSQRLKYHHAFTLTDAHLREGHDVVIADLLEYADLHEKFERIALANNAVFREFVLLAPKEDAIERCKARARRMGYEDGFRPGGVLDTHGREQMLSRMYDNVLGVIALRPDVTVLTPELGDIDGTYQQLVSAISQPSS